MGHKTVTFQDFSIIYFVFAFYARLAVFKTHKINYRKVNKLSIAKIYDS